MKNKTLNIGNVVFIYFGLLSILYFVCQLGFVLSLRVISFLINAHFLIYCHCLKKHPTIYIYLHN